MRPRQPITYAQQRTEQPSTSCQARERSVRGGHVIDFGPQFTYSGDFVFVSLGDQDPPRERAVPRFISNTERNGELINAIHHEGATLDNEFLRTSYEYVDRIL